MAAAPAEAPREPPGGGSRAGQQAPRVAVVCFSCEELVAAGSTVGVPMAARQLRDAVAEVSQRLGIRLPVYVLFTKADRIPHFEEYVRGLSQAEAQELLGATLPLAEVAAGGYADFQTARLREAFDGIFRSLARWRLELLPREGAEASRTRAYEFPREVRKVSDLASTFLLELCRPSQLGINPFLRGFYFTGVRPLLVSDSSAAPAPAAPQQARSSFGATGVFAINELAAMPQGAPPPTGSRRVPDWVFLRRILPEIVLKDDRARRMTAGGARVDLLRRSLIGAAAAFLLILSTGFTVSYAGNRALLTSGRAALESVRTLRPAVGEPPALAALTQLDGLGTAVDSLSMHERSGPPLRLRWGLYSGDEAREPLRQVYFQRFAAMLWNDTREDLHARLQNLPAEPQQTADYAATYAALKAYLVTTSHPEESDPAFLTPTLMESWRYADGLDPERQSLSARQFDLYGRELPLGNPFPSDPSEAVVIAARGFLQRFTGVEPFYRALLTEAGGMGEPIQFSRLHPAAAAVLRNDFIVPAEFTRPGFDRVQEILGDVDALLTREDWVLGERASIAPGERAQLTQELRRLYLRDYVSSWRDYLAAGSLVSFSGAQDAARKLELLGGNESPLLQMLALASLHTAVDTTVMRQTFQPVYAVVPAGPAERFITDANSPYVGALRGLWTAMQQVADAPASGRDMAVGQAAGSVEQVSVQVQALASNFNVDGEARVVGGHVQRLLESPVAASRGLVRALPAAAMNADGASFCSQFRTLEAKYPFNPRATSQASIDEVSAALQPGNSALWTFYGDALQPLLVPQGNQFGARVGADPQPNPAFVSFFNRAAALSRGLFPDEAASPLVRFSLAVQTSDALPEVTVTIDGQSHTFTRTLPAGHAFTWDGARARSVRISTQAGGANRTLLEATDGPWALVRLLRLAQWTPSGADRYSLQWDVADEPGTLTGSITFARGAVFAPNSLRLDCVSQIVR